jgi:hypothetical protein
MAAVTVYALAIVPNFVRRRRRTRTMMLRFWFLNLAITVLTVAALRIAQPGAEIDGQTVISGVFALAWLLYFQSSRDVTETFVSE